MQTLSVVHSLPTWLPLTSPWLYEQVVFVPPAIQNLVVCERTDHLYQFAFKNLYPLCDAPKWRYYSDLILRKVRYRRHLGYLTHIAKKYDAKVVHSHWGDVAWRDIYAAKAVRAKHVVTFYGKDVNYLPFTHPIWLKRYKELFDHIDLVLCEGMHMASCIEKLGCHPNKIKVHHLGVDTQNIEYKKREWGPNEPLKILIAASFREKKGIPYALEALGQLQHEVPIEITIIGDSSEDIRSHAEKEKILLILNKTGLLAKTTLLGYQPHSKLFKEAYRHHIFISPSVTATDGDTEGGAPVALIDMAATGILIISSNHCDIPSIVKHGETGLLAPERDSHALLDHFRYLIKNKDVWDSMTLAGRKRVENEYDSRRQADRLAEIYKRLIFEA